MSVLDNVKIAIVCDWLTAIGGAEKVLREMLSLFPQADLFCLVDFLDVNSRKIIHNKTSKVSFIQKLPLASKKYRSYLPLMPLAIEQFDLKAYPLVISSSHAVAKGVITNAQQLHISYIHTPMRYAWDLHFDYLEEAGLNKKWYGFLARYFLHRLRMWDFYSTKHVDHCIANSHYIAKRIRKTYHRSADVIYPPIDTASFKPYSEKEDYFITASRLVPYKKIDLIVESFKALPDKKLIVIGDGPEMKRIKSKAPSNVEILGFQTQETMVNYLQRAKAFIFAADEDFGIAPLEAQSVGTPVIAFGKGGALETIRGLPAEKPTGIFFQEQKKEALIAAIQTFIENEALFKWQHCVENANRFATNVFRNQFKTYVEDKFTRFLDEQ